LPSSFESKTFIFAVAAKQPRESKVCGLHVVHNLCEIIRGFPGRWPAKELQKGPPGGFSISLEGCISDKTVDSILRNGPTRMRAEPLESDEKVFRKFGAESVTHGQMKALRADDNMQSDVINYFVKMFRDHCGKEGKTVVIVDTYFMDKLLDQEGKTVVIVDTMDKLLDQGNIHFKKMSSWFESQWSADSTDLLVPWNQNGNHWVLWYVNLREKSRILPIIVDSMSEAVGLKVCAQGLTSFLKTFFSKKERPSEWSSEKSMIGQMVDSYRPIESTDSSNREILPFDFRQQQATTAEQMPLVDPEIARKHGMYLLAETFNTNVDMRSICANIMASESDGECMTQSDAINASLESRSQNGTWIDCPELTCMVRGLKTNAIIYETKATGTAITTVIFGGADCGLPMFLLLDKGHYYWLLPSSLPDYEPAVRTALRLVHVHPTIVALPYGPSFMTFHLVGLPPDGNCGFYAFQLESMVRNPEWLPGGKYFPKHTYRVPTIPMHYKDRVKKFGQMWNRTTSIRRCAVGLNSCFDEQTPGSVAKKHYVREMFQVPTSMPHSVVCDTGCGTGIELFANSLYGKNSVSIGVEESSAIHDVLLAVQRKLSATEKFNPAVCTRSLNSQYVKCWEGVTHSLNYDGPSPNFSPNMDHVHLMEGLFTTKSMVVIDSTKLSWTAAKKYMAVSPILAKEIPKWYAVVLKNIACRANNFQVTMWIKEPEHRSVPVPHEQHALSTGIVGQLITSAVRLETNAEFNSFQYLSDEVSQFFTTNSVFFGLGMGLYDAFTGKSTVPGQTVTSTLSISSTLLVCGIAQERGSVSSMVCQQSNGEVILCDVRTLVDTGETIRPISEEIAMGPTGTYFPVLYRRGVSDGALCEIPMGTTTGTEFY
jgi:hypothetical protein